MSVAETFLAVVQLARVANETVALYQEGKITDEQLKARWTGIRTRLKETDARWEEMERQDADDRANQASST